MKEAVKTYFIGITSYSRTSFKDRYGLYYAARLPAALRTCYRISVLLAAARPALRVDPRVGPGMLWYTSPGILERSGTGTKFSIPEPRCQTMLGARPG